jgi:hypothetical protein
MLETLPTDRLVRERQRRDITGLPTSSWYDLERGAGAQANSSWAAVVPAFLLKIPHTARKFLT